MFGPFRVSCVCAQVKLVVFTPTRQQLCSRLGHAQTVTVRTKLVNRLPVERLLRPDTRSADPDKTDTGPKTRGGKSSYVDVGASTGRRGRAGEQPFLVRRQPGVTRGSHVTPSHPNRDPPTITSRRPRQECGSHGVESLTTAGAFFKL